MAGASKATNSDKPVSMFSKENYVLMLVGLIVAGIGFYLLAGGRSADPKEFNPQEVYSTTRITIAPMLIVLGFVIEVFAIMKKSKSNG